MKNALIGYTYQHYLACLLLSMMDVERKIDKLTLEADVTHKFDDITLEVEGQKYFSQIKDLDGIKVADLTVTENSISINNSLHKLSEGINLLFFKKIDIKSNCKILGFNAQKIFNVYLISLTREEVEKRIAKLYRADHHRREVIQNFFSKKLDNRALNIERKQLPSIIVFDTRLIEKNVKIARKILDFEEILHIEGKPGVGKSHLVSFLQQQFRNNVLYRFWISNQDRQYEDRLKYVNFKSDLIKKIFFDQKERSEEEILSKLEKDHLTLIIDGLDHVENYQNSDLNEFVEFIDRAKAVCKVIVLSRPLRRTLNWKKQVLRNWNSKQTHKILKELYHLDEYRISENIYKLTDGYPILVKYIAEEYKKDGVVPVFATLDTVNHYYDQLFKNETGKMALGLFLCCRGYIMHSEIRVFLGETAGSIVEEIISERPYLFELKLNRVSLYHDSLITYLRNSGLNFEQLTDDVNTKVFNSLISGQYRFQSRIGHFDLPYNSVVAVIRWYSMMENFKAIIKNVIDYEAISEFYGHLRELLSNTSSEILNISQYYSLALILNLIERDHLSTLNGFYYTYATLLYKNGYSEEDITSSKYLFGMTLYLKNQDGSFLHDVMSDNYFDTKRFYSDLEADIADERDFFHRRSHPYKKSSIEKALANTRSTSFSDNLKEILVNVYQYKDQHKPYNEIYTAIEQFLNDEKVKATQTLGESITNVDWPEYRFGWVLKDANELLLALGHDPNSNDYINLTLKQYLEKHKSKGSFTLWKEVLSYLRLALHSDRKIDVTSISAFWTKYYQRKDYSLLALDYALILFEEKGYIDWRDSVKLITEIQEISEKGYRGLLASYLMKHGPAFTLQVLGEFDLRNLHVSWFELSPEYIDVLPQYVYNSEMGRQLDYHRYNQEIDIKDIANLLYSNKLDLLKEDLSFARYTIRIEDGDKRHNLLKTLGIEYKIFTDEHKRHSVGRDEERYGQGILDTKNQSLIRQKGLSPTDVALLTDGNNTALANPEIFLEFDKSVLQEQMQGILFNVLTGRSRSGGSFNIQWLLPGTMLRLIDDSGADAEFDDLFKSFVDYLQLSMFDIEHNLIKS